MPSTPRPARQRTRRPLERPGELLEAAIAVFQEHGYEASSLDDVAAAAGVTKGAIYHHFAGKADLLEQALHHRLRENFREVEARVDTAPGASAEERLRTVLRFAWDRWSSPEFARFLGLLGEVGRSHPELVRLWVEQGPSVGATIVARIIREGQRSGEFDRTLDAAATGWFILSGITFRAILGSAGAEGREGPPPRARRRPAGGGIASLIRDACLLLRAKRD